MKGQALEEVGEENRSPTLRFPASAVPTTVDEVDSSIEISGSNNTFTGLTEYVTGIEVSGSKNIYEATQSTVLPLPVEYDIDDYKPGGVAAEAAQQEGRYHYIGGDLKVSSSGEVLDGLYYVTGDVKLSGRELSGEVTIVAQGRIHVSGSNHGFTAYSGDLLFFSQEGYGGQKGCSKAVIEVAGSGMVWDGVVYAPGGLIEVSGNDSVLKEPLIGAAIKLSGSNLEIGFYAELDGS